MKSGGILEIVLKGLMYLLIQFFLLNEITLFGAAQAWVYIAVIITMPANIPRIQLLLIALVYGLLIDVFNNTLGMHAACAVLVAFSKEFFLKLYASQLPSSNNSDGETLTVRTNGLSWFLMYAGSLVFIYQTTFYLIDAAGFSWLIFTVKKIILSTLFTLTVMVILQYIIYPSHTKR